MVKLNQPTLIRPIGTEIHFSCAIAPRDTYSLQILRLDGHRLEQIPTLRVYRILFRINIHMGCSFFLQSISILDFAESSFFGEFDEPRENKSRKTQFADFIDSFLQFRKTENLIELNIRFYHLNDSALMSRADAWFSFALKNLHGFNLDFSPDLSSDEYFPVELYHLPRFCSPSKLLKDLVLNFCRLEPSLHKNFLSLQTVSLSQVQLVDDSVQALINNSPHLHSLRLEYCWFKDSKFDIDAPCSRLTHLRLSSNSVNEYLINIPSFLQFEFLGEIDSEYNEEMQSSFYITSLLNLIDASLQFEQMYLYSAYGGILSKLLEDMDHTTKLKISNFCLQDFSDNLMSEDYTHISTIGVKEFLESQRQYFPALAHLRQEMDLMF
ncbi:hypothetical protein NE237_031639 [Protea cynaroides]|uniref:At1g61320/AtMIF1 LRR domain-containing protein n=1 Tax=Protea cynaroides TaxID=273540 RepID=A0A9Q0R2P8_9MAGN|nr:hypothetical protein NE237_031639 [Protea cynaroides]